MPPQILALKTFCDPCRFPEKEREKVYYDVSQFFLFVRVISVYDRNWEKSKIDMSLDLKDLFQMN